MNRLLTLSIVIALLTATTANGGEVSVFADPLTITINGNPASGQEFTVGDTITITCGVVAGALIDNVSPTAVNYRATADSTLGLYYGTVIEPPTPPAESPLIDDFYSVIDEDYPTVSVAVSEILSITYTLTEEGLHTIRAYSVARVFKYTGAWGQVDYAESGPVYLTFNVVATPSDPAEEILELLDTVESMNLQQGINNSLNAKLNAAMAAMERGNTQAATNVLKALIHQVEAQRGKKITNEQADILVAAAQAIIDLLSS